MRASSSPPSQSLHSVEDEADEYNEAASGKATSADGKKGTSINELIRRLEKKVKTKKDAPFDEIK